MVNRFELLMFRYLSNYVDILPSFDSTGVQVCWLYAPRVSPLVFCRLKQQLNFWGFLHFIIPHCGILWSENKSPFSAPPAERAFTVNNTQAPRPCRAVKEVNSNREEIQLGELQSHLTTINGNVRTVAGGAKPGYVNTKLWRQMILYLTKG